MDNNEINNEVTIASLDKMIYHGHHSIFRQNDLSRNR